MRPLWGSVTLQLTLSVLELDKKELIKLWIYRWAIHLLYALPGSVTVWTLLFGNLQQYDFYYIWQLRS
jgi:hypothetical protein